MPVFVKARSGNYQLRVIHKLLPKPYFRTFSEEAEARAYGQQLESALARGLLPSELAGPGPQGSNTLLTEVIEQYRVSAPMTGSDGELLKSMLTKQGGLHGARLEDITFEWADSYVRRLKVEKNLAPGTVRKRVGALARVLDWNLRRTGQAENLGSNPLRLLGPGYSHYTADEAEKVGRENVKVDRHRDFRLSPRDHERVLWALMGGKRTDRERALTIDPNFQRLFMLAVETGLRLSEMYRLRIDQIDLVKGIIRVEGSKGARGVLKPRTVPMKRILRGEMEVWCSGRSGLLFPYWDGTREGLKKASAKLSFRFRTLFEYAGVENLTEHDLRHEACCRWHELRGADGRWVFSDVEVCKIMGWSSMSMMLRYASLRGEDLANRLL